MESNTLATRLAGRRIILGVTGGIAAYKSAELVRRLRDAGAEVRAVMTRGAQAFITPLTLQAVSGQPVHTELLDARAESGMGHIELARWADAVLVAPASANFLARLTHGLADDLLSTLCLATGAPLAVAPAMNRVMWDNPATQANAALLRARGVRVFGPGSGAQACGESGEGRMLEPDELVDLTAGLFVSGLLAGRRVLVTAGPTWEAIDPVRMITNRSSGKMGYAVAAAARDAGARVVLVSGPTALAAPAGVDTVPVISAADMLAAVERHIDDTDIFIGVAAVADYRPVSAAPGKIKKSADTLALDLVRNPDILAAVAARRPRPFMVGFAAETSELEHHAREKLLAKQLDLVAANLVGGAEGGFEADTNSLTLVDRNSATVLPSQSKTLLARALISSIAERFHAQDKTQDPRLAHRQ